MAILLIVDMSRDCMSVGAACTQTQAVYIYNLLRKVDVFSM